MEPAKDEEGPFSLISFSCCRFPTTPSCCSGGLPCPSRTAFQAVVREGEVTKSQSVMELPFLLNQISKAVGIWETRKNAYTSATNYGLPKFESVLKPVLFQLQELPFKDKKNDILIQTRKMFGDIC